MRLRPLLITMFLLCMPLTAHADVYQIGESVDDFTLPDLDGELVSLSDFAGNVILLNFFATW